MKRPSMPKDQLREDNLPGFAPKRAAEFLCIVDLTPTDDRAGLASNEAHPVGGCVALSHPPNGHSLISAYLPASVALYQFDGITGLYPSESLMGRVVCRL